jgi:uncharacterized protein (DUF1697 family)
MKTYISLLRAINVGGQNAIRKNELLELYQALGYAEVVTYLQSGNVIFNSIEENAQKVAGDIEAKLKQTFDSDIAVVVRDAPYFQEILANNPYLKIKTEDPKKLHVTFLYQPPQAEKLHNVQIPIGESAEFSTGNQAIYLYCPDGYGQTKITNAFFERKLGLLATTRNWNTVNALYTMALKQQG